METKVYTNSAVNADFTYDDTDDYQNEIAELYSYAEEKDFEQNFSDFQIEGELLKLPPLNWQIWDHKMQYNFIMKMVDQLENCSDKMRMRAARSILYLAQGCWAEVQSIEEQQDLTRENVQLLFKAGVFHSMIDMLNMELEKDAPVQKSTGESDDTQAANMKDSNSLKVVCNVLYIILETIRNEQQKRNPDYKIIVEECISEMKYPLCDGLLLPIKLFHMISKFCNGTGAHFPIKKLLLLLWKSSLLFLGNTAELRCLKNELRAKYNLEYFCNDTLNVSKYMQASIISREDSSTPKRLSNSGRRNRGLWDVIFENVDVSRKPVDAGHRIKRSIWSSEDESNELPDMPIKFETSSINTTLSTYNSLLFEPKVRLKDIEIFLQNARQKYFGYYLEGDNETLIGLPLPVQESVRALRRHLYISLSEKQIEEEQLYNKYPFRKDLYESTPIEELYQALLPNFRKCVTDLLRILLASSPSAKLTTGSLNSRIVAEMIPKSLTSATIFSNCVQTDIVRQKEIIVKAITAILLLYLKHLKVNHINQFEYMSQLMAQSSFIKLALQVFTPIIPEYVSLKTTIPRREFPVCVLEQFHEEYTNEHIYVTGVVTESAYSWRNLFSSVNIMRILNKLIKWKNSRILNMVSLKSTGSLKEVLQIRQPLLQIYVLKLLKMQARYLGRCWRRNNLKVMTAIYTKVRHRFNDDWAYGCDTVAKFWNAQEEEFELRLRVMRFHCRRYPNVTLDCELTSILPSPAKKSLKGAKSASNISAQHCSEKSVKKSNSFSEFSDVERRSFLFLNNHNCEEMDEMDDELPELFKQNYETWLDDQIYSQNFDWDAI